MSEIAEFRSQLSAIERAVGHLQGAVEGIAEQIKSAEADRRVEIAGLKITDSEMQSRQAKLEKRVNIFHGIFLAAGALFGYQAKTHIG